MRHFEPFPFGLSSSRFRFVLIFLFFGSVFLRLIYFIQSGANPLMYMPVLDEVYYIGLGKAIATGFWLGEDHLFFMDPMYGYLLGFIFYTVGDNLTAVRLVQILADSLNVILIYFIGAKVWSQSAGLLAAVFYSVYKVAFYYTLLILKTTGTVTLSLLFTLALIHTSERGRGLNWFFLGVFAGAITYFRANLLLMAPLAVLAYWIVERPTYRKLFTNGVLLAAGLLAALSVGAARNYLVSGEIVFLNTQTGRLLYSSNNPDNLTGHYSVPSFSRRTAEGSERDFHLEAERRLGRKLGAKEVSAYWRVETFNFLRQNPGAVLTLLYKKIEGTVGNHEIPNNHSSDSAARFSPLARLPLPTFAFAFALGIPGLAYGLAKNRKVVWTLPPLIMVLVTVLIFYTSSRFRMPAVPFLLIGSAILVSALKEFILKKEMWKATSFIALALGLSGLSFAASDPRSTGDEEYLLAKAYWNVNAFEEAKLVSNQSIKMFPGDSRFHMMLGMIALSENRIALAVKKNQDALKLNPSNADAYHNMGLALLASGREEEAVDSIKKAYLLNPRPQSLFALAKVYDKTGDTRLAIVNYKKFIAISKPGVSHRKRAAQRIKELSAKKIGD